MLLFQALADCMQGYFTLLELSIVCMSTFLLSCPMIVSNVAKLSQALAAR